MTMTTTDPLAGARQEAHARYARALQDSRQARAAHQQAVQDAVALARAVAALQRVLTGSSALRRSLMLTLDSAHGRACQVVQHRARDRDAARLALRKVREQTYVYRYSVPGGWLR